MSKDARAGVGRSAVGRGHLQSTGCHSFPRLVKTTGLQNGPSWAQGTEATPWTPSAEQDAKARSDQVQGWGAHTEFAARPCLKPPFPGRVREYLTSFRNCGA